MASMADVAKAAGVSQTTVSHVLSGKRRVSPELTHAVRRAMQELGYTPSHAAQTLATGSTRMIALVVPDIANSFFAELTNGVESFARSAGYSVLLANTGFDHSEERSYLELLASRAVDGVVYAAGVPPGADELQRLLGVVPTVLVDEDIPGSGLDAIVSDNQLGGHLVAQHLLELGHTRALIIDCPSAPTSDSERVAGFAAEWEATGGSFWRVSGDFRMESGIAAMGQGIPLVERHGITAVFATNDLMAFGALMVLRENGFDVPHAVSLVGFDNSFASVISVPSLTTVRQSVNEMGRLAVARLLERLKAPEAPAEKTILSVKLVRRNSTGPNPGGSQYRIEKERRENDSDDI